MILITSNKHFFSLASLNRMLPNYATLARGETTPRTVQTELPFRLFKRRQTTIKILAAYHKHDAQTITDTITNLNLPTSIRTHTPHQSTSSQGYVTQYTAWPVAGPTEVAIGHHSPLSCGCDFIYFTRCLCNFGSKTLEYLTSQRSRSLCIPSTVQ